MNPTSVGAIKYDVSLDTSKFKRDARDVDNQAKSLGDGIASSFKNAERSSKILLATVTGVGLAFGALFTKYIIKGGIDRALNIEDAQAKLKGLGHDTENVQKIMDSALKSVLGTAFGLDSAATAAASAVAAGVKPGEQLTRVLALTADSATIMGREFGEAGQIINKVLASNRVSMREVNQLHQAGVPILTMLAGEYGVTADEMSKMVSSGVVDSERFLRAIEKNIGGAALASGDTTRGAWANLQAAMARVGANIVQDILPKFRDAFLSLRVWFDDNAQRITDVFSGLADWLLATLEKIVGFFSESKNVYMFAGAITFALVPAVVALAKSFILLMLPLVKFMLIGAAIGALAYFIRDNWNTIGPVWENVTNKAKEFWDTIKPLREFVVSQFISAFNDLKAAFNSAREALEPHMPVLKEVAKIIGGVVIFAIINFIAQLTAVIVISARVIGWIAKIISFFISLASTTIQNMKRFASAVATAVTAVINFFRFLPARILGALGNLGNLLSNAGRSIMQGLVNGIKSMASAPVNALRSVVGNMRNLLPFSPAKEGPFSGRGWVAYSGQSIAEGLASGLTRGASAAVSATEQMVNAMSNSLPTLAMDSMATGGTSVENNIGVININSGIEAEDWLTRLTRDEEVTERGMTSV
jgi:tape measure domain-containing protein